MKKSFVFCAGVLFLAQSAHSRPACEKEKQFFILAKKNHKKSTEQMEKLEIKFLHSKDLSRLKLSNDPELKKWRRYFKTWGSAVKKANDTFSKATEKRETYMQCLISKKWLKSRRDSCWKDGKWVASGTRAGPYVCKPDGVWAPIESLP